MSIICGSWNSNYEISTEIKILTILRRLKRKRSKWDWELKSSIRKIEISSKKLESKSRKRGFNN